MPTRCHLCGRDTFIYNARSVMVCEACLAPHDQDAGWKGYRFRTIREREMFKHHGLLPEDKGYPCVLRVIRKRCRPRLDCPCRAYGIAILEHTRLWRDGDRRLVWTSEPYNLDQAALDEAVAQTYTPLGIGVQVGGYSPHSPGATTLLRFRALRD
ncbi:hypothetical protein [Rhodococcus sp. NPDC049939]|uniref:hypothetical protein n=1 Tax=Rhodococcus sp. NPDC049939 TaxID=3155511 RepID=UPI0033C39144